MAGQSRMERLGTEAIHPGARLDVCHSDSTDFRGYTDQPGSKGQYADVPIHAGLICINGPDSMSAEDETELFGIVLDELGQNEMVNQAIEITLSDPDGGFELVRYALPQL